MVSAAGDGDGRAAAGRPQEAPMETHIAPREDVLDEKRGVRSSAPETARTAPVDVADVPVRTVMATRVLVTTPDDDILLAWETLLQAGIRHLPVIEGTRLVGMIDDRQLLGACALRPLVAGPRTVRELVDHPPLQVHADTPLRIVAARMTADRVDAVCVTTPTGGLLGLVTASDLIRALAGRSVLHRESDAATVTPLLFRFTPMFPVRG
jgi:acetoin utilization protein AcuB